jgi:7-cyano-7-deazaguanine synthase in queuosine biosynthesis
MIPDTKNGLNAMTCVSAMQKAIRRGMEREAMEFASELMHTSKAFHTMTCNRLEVIRHEDLDTIAAPGSCRSSPHRSQRRETATASRSVKPG